MTCVVALHVLKSLHTVFVVSVGSFWAYSLDFLQIVVGAQTRSLLGVRAMLSYAYRSLHSTVYTLQSPSSGSLYTSISYIREHEGAAVVDASGGAVIVVVVPGTNSGASVVEI